MPNRRQRGRRTQHLVAELPVCHIDDCTAEHVAHGLCGTHYARWRKWGDPYYVEESTGRPFPRKHDGCQIDGCDRPHHAHGYCSRHARSLARHGDPLAAGTWGGQRGRQDVVTYDAAHWRLRADRGSPSDYQCVDCGGRAAEWSLRKDAPDVLTSPDGRTYTLNIDGYDPRCIRCHRHYDDSVAALIRRWETR